MAVAAAAGLWLPASVASALRAHARAEMPNEACGLLSGEVATGRVTAFHPARNEHASPYRFSVDPRDLVRITYAIEAAGEQLVAVFHSHPDGDARPSATDLREARYPMALQLVAGRQPDFALRAWRCSGAQPEEVTITVG